jgi:ABC-type Mn2+/Zn2+ transport system permease subunit
VIADFIDSWALFQTTYLAGWLIAFLLSLVGVWVVARDQIFLGIAVAQASTLGIAAAIWLGGIASASAWASSDATAAVFAVTASIATALLTARSGHQQAESAEAVTGWVYLVAASVPVLLLARSPHGLEEVHALLFSTILGASGKDVRIFGILALASALLAAGLTRRLLLFAMDPEMAVAVGMRQGLWNTALAIWLGLVVGLSIRVSGTLYTFGCLVLPALVGKHWVREMRPLLVVAPTIAVGAAIAGFVLANHFDTPPAHTTVGLLCFALPLGWLRRRWRVRRATA